MRICCNIALVDIICHALSYNHPGVLKEQRVSCEDHSRPGNVYHPDFQYGCAAYFELSVWSITQCSYISSALSCVGVTAMAVDQGPHTSRCCRCDFSPGGGNLWRVVIF